jgi:AcrR family transcriptional regulator
VTQQRESTAWHKRVDYDRSESATRDQILQAAEEVFAEFGYAKSSVERIAERAGVSRATFYVYFTSRKEAFCVLARLLIDGVVEAQRARDAAIGDPRAVISVAVHSILALFAKKTQLIVAIEQQSKFDDEVRALWDIFWDGQIKRASNFIRRLQQSGDMDQSIDADMAGECMAALTLHYGMRSAGASPEEINKTADKIAQLNERMWGLDR